jgi:hypothetical protein
MFRFTKRLLPLKYSDQHLAWISHHVCNKAKWNVMYGVATTNFVDNAGNGLQCVGCTFWYEAWSLTCGRERERDFFFFLFEHDLSRGIIRLFIETICFGWLSHYHHAYQWKEYKFKKTAFISPLAWNTCILSLYPVSMNAAFPQRPSYNYLQEYGFPVNICTSEWSVLFASTWIPPNFIIGLLSIACFSFHHVHRRERIKLRCQRKNICMILWRAMDERNKEATEEKIWSSQ